MKPAAYGFEKMTFEELFITDLRSFRVVAAILRAKYSTVIGIHVTDEAFKNIWFQASGNELTMHYSIRMDAQAIQIDGIAILGKDNSYWWSNEFLQNLGQKP
jgi:hypothetical protein